MSEKSFTALDRGGSAAISSSVEAIESEVGERVRETNIEYEGGELLRCTYSVVTSRVGAELLQEMKSFKISTDHGEIDLFEVLKIGDSIPVIIASGGPQYAAFFDRSGKMVKNELRIPEPKTPEDFAFFLHEVGHFTQVADETFLPGARINNVDYMQLIKGGQAAKKSFSSFSYAWFDVQNILPNIPRTAIRERFRTTFDRFLLKLPQIHEMFDQFYELEGERSELEGDRMRENGYAPLPPGQESEREKELLRLIEELILTIPMQEILFFLTEPVRHYERDATRRAVVWLKSFGEHLKIAALSRLDDAGTEQLFSSLDTYNHGCVKGVIAKGEPEGASV